MTCVGRSRQTLIQWSRDPENKFAFTATYLGFRLRVQRPSRTAKRCFATVNGVEVGRFYTYAMAQAVAVVAVREKLDERLTVDLSPSMEN